MGVLPKKARMMKLIAKKDATLNLFTLSGEDLISIQIILKFTHLEIFGFRL